MIRYKNINMLLIAISLVVALNTVYVPSAQAAVQSLVFPVIGPSSYSDDFKAARFNGEHKATDIFGNKHQPIVSASDGTIQYVRWWESAGYSIRILGTDGVVYNYYHLNNDRRGTDDGKSGEMGAYTADVKEGNPVIKGQLLGYLGDSGNAEDTPPHLHFEIYSIQDGGSVGNPYDGGKAVNPFTHLNNAERIGKPRLYPALPNETLPYGIGAFRGGARISAGDTDGDSIDEIIVAAGPGGSSIRIFESDGTQVTRFDPYPNGFAGGMDVATGDMDGDGIDEIVVAAGPGGSSIRIFKADGAQIARFDPYAANGFTGGMDVATGDMDGDGIDEIVVAAGPGGSSIRVFKADGTQLALFNPFTSKIKSGASIAVGDVMGDDAIEIVAAPKRGGSPTIVTLSMNGVRQYAYTPYDISYRGGLRIETGELNTSLLKNEIISVPEQYGSSVAKVTRANGRFLWDASNFAENWWLGYYDTVVVNEEILVSLNVNRRTSLRYAQ